MRHRESKISNRWTGPAGIHRQGYYRTEKMKNAKAEFISVVSHELRTPLTAIRGSLGLLRGGVVGALPGIGANMVAMAYQNTERLSRMINDLLDMQK